MFCGELGNLSQLVDHHHDIVLDKSACAVQLVKIISMPYLSPLVSTAKPRKEATDANPHAQARRWKKRSSF